MNQLIKTYSGEVPVLFILFNRPDTTQEVFQAIQKAKPKKLYIAADGPRAHKEGERAKCMEVRKVAEQVDWDCEVRTLFQDENLGCKKGVISAIDWLFENEERGIILEDDCVPSQSFFTFCEDVLEKYKDDARIMHVAGFNHMPEEVRDPDYSYYFSYYGNMWGWASWRRAWQLNNVELPHFEEIVHKGLIYDMFDNKAAAAYYLRRVGAAYKGDVDTWDYQWDFNRLTNSGLSIIPYTNMVHNIGFREDATHTVSSKNWAGMNIAKEMEFPVSHPAYIMRDLKTDNKYFKHLMKWTVQRKLFGLIGINGFSVNG